jgi:hypothetical protein
MALRHWEEAAQGSPFGRGQQMLWKCPAGERRPSQGRFRREVLLLRFVEQGRTFGMLRGTHRWMHLQLAWYDIVSVTD